jgi:hypothetical protein
MDDLPPLKLLQRLWVGVAVGIVALVTVAVVGADAEANLPVVLPAGLAAAGGLAAVLGNRAVDRTFAASPPADDRSALVEFRTRSFLQVAIAEAPTLLAFALTFVIGPNWVAAIGGLASLTALAVARPTAARVRAIESAWQAAGRDVSVLRAAQAPDRDPEHD